MTTSDWLSRPTVEGPVQGIEENEVFVFKGIPYAKPPVGDLRWRPPKDVVPWTKDVRKAGEYGNACYQNREMCTAVGGGDPGPLSEDCLYLNVWTPKRDPGADLPLLPVMVWIHGGAYVIGAGGLPPYIGSPLVKKGAVVVTINYRLGHLGFFAHRAWKASARRRIRRRRRMRRMVRSTTSACSIRSPRSSGCGETSRASGAIRGT